MFWSRMGCRSFEAPSPNLSPEDGGEGQSKRPPHLASLPKTEARDKAKAPSHLASPPKTGEREKAKATAKAISQDCIINR
jgi:hypothetical protein